MLYTVAKHRMDMQAASSCLLSRKAGGPALPSAPRRETRAKKLTLERQTDKQPYSLVVCPFSIGGKDLDVMVQRHVFLAERVRDFFDRLVVGTERIEIKLEILIA
jgi:hypothetical protein